MHNQHRYYYVKLLALDFWSVPPVVQGLPSPEEKSIKDQRAFHWSLVLDPCLVKIPELQTASPRRDVSRLKPIHRLSTLRFQVSLLTVETLELLES